MRISSRAVIINKNGLLTMFRRKKLSDKITEYYVIPGGGKEENESYFENVVRELKEEMNVDIKVLGFLGVDDNESGSSYYFHCEITNGVPKLSGEELERMTDDNYYEPRYIKECDIESLDLFGKEFVKRAKKQTYLPLK